ncbi:hypothetical protein SJAG_06383 [Schizosaccharomyces japonicus yFS275]|uniref:Uncharacterized protein n=1 Tax=Schizosaccharomyces japonicus (strain yFS275 / FY16936) TaxID=402676 RepID=T0TB29_SCHJY|nr:hypothetical protein SJAG_06383 [Schizosaccharomyces japonicus yFS275]EQC53028.1 hypothetical protein SJAG_06383 [Schizosaccharomyces japonicus yFS275]
MGFLPQSKTALWGYAILAITWSIFVFGMIFVLGLIRVPIYIDGKSSPIQSYYPCLLVLMFTVVALVWVSFNWLGLKYFRHSPSAVKRS